MTTGRTETHPPADDIENIHQGTALYTAAPEIENLLDRIGWPECGGRLLDPGCGDGNMVIAALERLHLRPGDSRTALRVKGFEFHRQSVLDARKRYRQLLIERGWDPHEAHQTANLAIEERDFLLDPREGAWDIILSNPPYWRRMRLPERYRQLFDEAVPPHARGDLLHAYLDRCLSTIAPEGRLALVTSDRWLTNATAADLREAIGQRLKIEHAERLTNGSPFHRPKGQATGKSATGPCGSARPLRHRARHDARSLPHRGIARGHGDSIRAARRHTSRTMAGTRRHLPHR